MLLCSRWGAEARRGCHSPSGTDPLSTALSTPSRSEHVRASLVPAGWSSGRRGWPRQVGGVRSQDRPRAWALNWDKTTQGRSGVRGRRSLSDVSGAGAGDAGVTLQTWGLRHIAERVACSRGHTCDSCCGSSCGAVLCAWAGTFCMARRAGLRRLWPEPSVVAHHSLGRHLPSPASFPRLVERH